MKKYLIFIMSSFIFSGCLMPYKEEFRCQLGANNGVCANAGEIYNMKSIYEKSNDNETKDLTQIEKEQLILISNENNDLKNIVEALSIDNITKGRIK